MVRAWTQEITMFASLVGALSLGCVNNTATVLVELDLDFYKCHIEPIVLQSCAFGRCHSDPGRPYRLAHPHLMRYDSTGKPLGSATRAVAKRGLATHETILNYQATMAIALSYSPYGESLLVFKPLDEDVGGAHHEGGEIFGGGDVFATAEDERLLTLQQWIDGTHRDATCVF